MKNDLVISVSICLLVKKKKSIFQTFAQCLIWPPCIFRSAFRREESCSGRQPLGGSGRGTVQHQLFLGPHRTATAGRRQAGLNTSTETRGVLQVCTLTGKTRMWRGMITRKKKNQTDQRNPGLCFSSYTIVWRMSPWTWRQQPLGCRPQRGWMPHGSSLIPLPFLSKNEGVDVSLHLIECQNLFKKQHHISAIRVHLLAHGKSTGHKPAGSECPAKRHTRSLCAPRRTALASH